MATSWAKVAKATESVHKYAIMAAAAIILVIFCLIMSDVVGRYLLNKTLRFVLDISQMGLFGLFFLPAGLLVLEGGHVRIDIVTNRLHGKTRIVFDLFASVMELVFSAFIVWKGWDIFWEIKQRGTVTMVTHLPMYPATVLIFLGGLFYLSAVVIVITREISYLARTDAIGKGQ